MVSMLILSLIFCQPVYWQTNQTQATQSKQQLLSITEQKIADLPRPVSKPPKITLRRALDIAELYIEREKIDASSFYLREVKLIFPTEKTEDQQWHLWWVSVNGEMGNYIEVVVSMDGKVKRIPSM